MERGDAEDASLASAEWAGRGCCRRRSRPLFFKAEAKKQLAALCQDLSRKPRVGRMEKLACAHVATSSDPTQRSHQQGESNKAKQRPFLRIFLQLFRVFFPFKADPILAIAHCFPLLP